MVHSEAVARACEVDSSDSVDVVSRVSLFCDSTGRLSTNGQRTPALGLLQIQIYTHFHPNPLWGPLLERVVSAQHDPSR